MAHSIVTLTTDFGLADHYVGAMKGVILGICPRAQIVDISHSVTPYAIAEGAYLIAQAYACFPRKTVHVVVVDPGVGGMRRPILVEASGQFFVGPDNGVLGMVIDREKVKVRHITSERYFRQPVSSTFHGRDVFSPVAAHLAAGVAAARMGNRIEDYVRGEFGVGKVAAHGAAPLGLVLHVDRFGNIVTNFHVDQLPSLAGQRIALTIGKHKVTALARNYEEAGDGLFAIVGSSGYLEVSVNQGSAAKRIGCLAGEPVRLVIS